jgi:hypothetical protein
MNAEFSNHLDALRLCLQRLDALDCAIVYLCVHQGDRPLIHIAAPTAALLDYLDAHQIGQFRAFSRIIAEVDGCGVAWSISANMRVDEVEEIELAA